ncbi:Uncharacterised protein [Mycobacteroides abscessus subsp. abscessus]|nr:Uncharacterised protein [Mycobacteroides abscessus subsp. abscessus]
MPRCRQGFSLAPVTIGVCIRAFVCPDRSPTWSKHSRPRESWLPMADGLHHLKPARVLSCMRSGGGCLESRSLSSSLAVNAGTTGWARLTGATSMTALLIEH